MYIQKLSSIALATVSQMHTISYSTIKSLLYNLDHIML